MKKLIIWTWLGFLSIGVIAEEQTEAAAPESQELEKEVYPYKLPLLGQKAIDAGEEIPLPLGLSVNYYYVKRDIEVKSISASLNANPLRPVDDLLNFDIQTRVQSAVARLDAWIFPFLNVYGLFGRIENESRIRAKVNLGGNEYDIDADGAFSGTTGGGGVVLAAGYNNFFMTVDGNLVFSQLGDSFDTTFKGQIYNARAGWKGKISNHNTRIWLGATYWDTEREMSGSIPAGSSTLNFSVVQAPANPTTYSLGFNYEFTQKWNTVVDVGTNFDDASSFLVALNYRFH